MKNSSLSAAKLMFLILAILLPGSVLGQTYHIVRVADSISNPELGHFNASYATPVIEGDYVVFRTLNNVNTIAFIWSWNRKTKEFVKLVDLDTPAPGGTGNFTELSGGIGGPILRGGIVVFGGRDEGAPASPAQNVGIYSVPVTGGAIQRIANYNTAVPGGTGNFFNFYSTSAQYGNFSYFDGVVGFEADFGGGPIGNSGIYQSDVAGSTIAPIADSLHEVGPLPFPNSNFTDVDVNSDRAAFIGGNEFGYNALYSSPLPATLGNYTKLIDVNTALPEGTGPFSFVLPSVRVSGDSIFFVGLDGVGGSSNNRHTLCEIPFSGGAASKIISNLDTLEGLSSIAEDSIQSYDVNSQNLFILANAPGTTQENNLYLFNRASRQFTQIFTTKQTILDRDFGFIADVQPGAISEDSTRAVASIAGSALFVGPYTYIVMLSTDSEDGEPSDIVGGILADIDSTLIDARKALPPKPDKSLPKNKKAKINAKRKAVKDARKSLTALLNSLVDSDSSSGDAIRLIYTNFTSDNLKELKKLAKAGGSTKNGVKAAKAAWKKFRTLLDTVEQKA